MCIGYSERTGCRVELNVSRRVYRLMVSLFDFGDWAESQMQFSHLSSAAASRISSSSAPSRLRQCTLPSILWRSKGQQSEAAISRNYAPMRVVGPDHRVSSWRKSGHYHSRAGSNWIAAFPDSEHIRLRTSETPSDETKSCRGKCCSCLGERGAVLLLILAVATAPRFPCLMVWSLSARQIRVARRLLRFVQCDLLHR